MEFIPAELVKSAIVDCDDIRLDLDGRVFPVVELDGKKYTMKQVYITDAAITSSTLPPHEAIRDMLIKEGFSPDHPIEDEYLPSKQLHTYVQMIPIRGIDHIKIDIKVPSLCEKHKGPPFDTIEELRKWMRDGCQL